VGLTALGMIGATADAQETISRGEQMDAPLTRLDFLRRIAAETARMSYPGSMSRGIPPVVCKGAKAKLEEYFVGQFPMAQVWDRPTEVVLGFETWHKEQSEAIAVAITKYVPKERSAVAISTKFLNTFLHQLMKYEKCRPLWNSLHLPLDRRVFKALAQLRPDSLSSVHEFFSQSPYGITYIDYGTIQAALGNYLIELNARPETGMHLTSRIELNWLWI